KPTLEKLAVVGGTLYQNLDDDSKQKWADVVAQTRPLIPLVEAARDKEYIQRALKQYLAQLPSAPPGIDQFTFDQVEQQLGKQVDKIAATEAAKISQVFDEILSKMSVQ